MASISLDADEYLHLALHASSRGEHHACLQYLKEVLRQQPKSAPATYLLATQHAEIGLVARAIEGFKAALALDPALEIARFQLGWILLDGQALAEARQHFAALDNSANLALRAFSQGMIALIENNPVLARERVLHGLTQRSTNPALTSIMRRLLERISVAADAVGKPTAAEEAAKPSGGQVFLGAYGQKTSN